jgi:hypothetical protein
MNDWCGEHAFAIEMYLHEPKPPEKALEPIYLYDIHTDTVKPKRKYTRKEKA